MEGQGIALLLVISLAVFGLCRSNPISRGPNDSKSMLKEHLRYAPKNYKDHPDGYWFGTQNLNCMMGWWFHRARRDVAPARHTLTYAHRLVFYGGKVFEWGVTSKMTYNVGYDPSKPHCEITWEEQPAGRSNCSHVDMVEFTKSYPDNYGMYNAFTNNCHHFANYFSHRLISGQCGMQDNAWQEFMRHLWQGLSSVVNIDFTILIPDGGRPARS
ncbi:unnamed protein product [Owenia fusiformis]|uniref:Uncharacterized protein n=1 Tax=Owenia fusiformis TaxID=6347 RepID=A0A8J1U3I8_OWEFU|nr:unnamed protein product [Owenia fusiformis]